MRWLVVRGSAPLVVAVAVACGGDGATGPVPCDAYTGGIVSGTLPGTYNLRSFCSGMKPDVPGASGTVMITAGDFSASVTIQGQTTTIGGTYVTNGSAITVDLGLAGQFAGTFRLRNDTLGVSGSLGSQSLSLLGTRVP